MLRPYSKLYGEDDEAGDGELDKAEAEGENGEAVTQHLSVTKCGVRS